MHVPVFEKLIEYGNDLFEYPEMGYETFRLAELFTKMKNCLVDVQKIELDDHELQRQCLYQLMVECGLGSVLGNYIKDFQTDAYGNRKYKNTAPNGMMQWANRYVECTMANVVSGKLEDIFLGRKRIMDTGQEMDGELQHKICCFQGISMMYTALLERYPIENAHIFSNQGEEAKHMQQSAMFGMYRSLLEVEAKLVQMQIAMWFDDQKLDYDMESMVKIHDYRVAMLEEKKQVFQRKWDIVTQDNVYLIQRMMDAAELKDTMDAFPIKNPKSLYTMFDRTVMYSMEGKLNRVQDESFSVLDHVDANVNPREEFHCQLALWLYVALDMAYAKFSQDENCVQKMDQLASSFGHHMTVPEHVQRAILCFWYIDNLSVFNEEFRQQALQRTFNILAKGNLSDKLSVDDRYAIIQNIQYVGQEQKHAAKIADALELPHTSLWPEHFNLIATSMYLDCGSWEIALQIQREVVSAENANDQTLQTKLLQMMFIWFERTSNVPNVMDLQLSSFEESMLIQFLLRPRDNHLASVGSIKAANFLIAYLLQQYKLEEAMEYDKAHRLALRSCGASHVLDGEEFKIRNAILQAHVRILYPGRKDTLERKLNGTMSTSMEVSDNTENSTFSMDGESKNPFLVAYRLSMENQNHSLSVVETVSHVSPPFRLSPPTKATTITNADPVLPPTSDKPIHLQIEKLRGASFSSPPSSYAASPIPSTKSKYSRSSRYKDTDSIASPMHHGDVQSPSIQLSKRLQMSPASSIASEVDHSTPVSKTPISTIESKSKFKHLTQRARYRALQTPPAKRLPKSKPDSSFHNQEHNALALRDDNTNDPMSGKPPTSPAASSTKKHQPYQFASVSTPPKTRSRSSKFETPVGASTVSSDSTKSVSKGSAPLRKNPRRSARKKY